MIIPAWDSMGILPPVRPGALGNSPDRSPYPVDLVAMVDRFATSSERKTILDGFLRLRRDLHQAGIVSGFQWVNGSFLEDVETREDRPPRDVDIVTFYNLPSGKSQKSLVEQNKALFNHERLKTDYNVDAYFTELGQFINQTNVKLITYWYSMWSHRRDGMWKGFLQVDLNPINDAAARSQLDNFHEGVCHE